MQPENFLLNFLQQDVTWQTASEAGDLITELVLICGKIGTVRKQRYGSDWIGRDGPPWTVFSAIGP